MAADWMWARRSWEKWAGKHVGASGKPVKAALLLNYDPTGPSRLLPVVLCSTEQSADGILLYWLKPVNIVIASSAFTDLVTSIHEHWFCARCVNAVQPEGEGVIVMEIGAYLLVCMYDGSLGSASQAMVAVDQFAWHFNRRTH
ncbi:uncharacterized protein [Oryza sativa Japonica Group]|uniref:uncharacterized protein isoform X2 n=1 Tax=Oryza sativa subsp. japonica TaxID=39947 RepID=UPI0007753DDF